MWREIFYYKEFLDALKQNEYYINWDESKYMEGFLHG